MYFICTNVCTNVTLSCYLNLLLNSSKMGINELCSLSCFCTPNDNIYIYVNYIYNVSNVCTVHSWYVLCMVLCFLGPTVFLLILVHTWLFLSLFSPIHSSHLLCHSYLQNDLIFIDSFTYLSILFCFYCKSCCFSFNWPYRRHSNIM